MCLHGEMCLHSEMCEYGRGSPVRHDRSLAMCGFFTMTVLCSMFYNHIPLEDLPLVQYSEKVNFMREVCVCFGSPLQLGCIVKCVLHTLTYDDVSFIHCVRLAPVHAKCTFSRNPTWKEVVGLREEKNTKDMTISTSTNTLHAHMIIVVSSGAVTNRDWFLCFWLESIF